MLTISQISLILFSMNTVKNFFVVFFFLTILSLIFFTLQDNIYAQSCGSCPRNASSNFCPNSQTRDSYTCKESSRLCSFSESVTSSCTFMGTTYKCCSETDKWVGICDPRDCMTDGKTVWISACQCTTEDPGPGGPGDPDPIYPGPSCNEQQNLIDPLKPRWLVIPQGEYYSTSVIPMKYIAGTNTGVKEISVQLRRYGTPTLEICRCSTKSCTGGCTVEIVNRDQCPNWDDICNIIISHPDLMPVMKANTGPNQNLFIPWHLRVDVIPKWGSTCGADAKYEVKDCDSSCPTPRCTVKEQDCGTGFTLQNTGPYCLAHKATCKQVNGCGKEIDCNEAQCYRPEKNTNPQPPTTPKLKIDGYTYTLSTNEDEWTRVRKPLPGKEEDAVKFSVTPQTPPSGTYRNPLFDFTAENMGVNQEWRDEWGNCVGVAGEDFCNHDRQSNTTDFHGTYTGHKTPAQILKEGAAGLISTRYHTQNICNDDRKYSGWMNSRYKVNYLPIVESVEITGNDTTLKGCKATAKFTGLDANNPLTITVTGSDPDGVNDINGLSVWLVKRGVGDLSNDIDEYRGMGSGLTTTNPNEIGMHFEFLERNQAHLYKANNENSANRLAGWGRDADNSQSLGTNKVQSSQGLLIEAATATHRTEGNKKIVTVTLQFPKQESQLIMGEYDVYVGFSDIFTKSKRSAEDGGGKYLDSQNVKNSGKNWSFDFVKPKIENTKLQTLEQKVQKLSWKNTDTGSGPMNTVINAYNNDSIGTEILRTIPSAGNDDLDRIKLQEVPGRTSIGNMPVSSGWKHIPDNVEVTSMTVNTLDLAAGNLRFYITLYDKACNYKHTGEEGEPPPEQNYDRWLSTKGGIFYSQGRVNYKTKDIADFNLGTELLSTGGTSIGTVRQLADDNKNPAIAKNIIDTNQQNRTSLFEELDRKLKNSMSKDLEKITNPLACNNLKGCYFSSENDINIGGTYSGKILIYSEKDITITGELKATSNNDAMFIFSKGNIVVNDGRVSNSTDRIDAFLMAKGRITIAQDADANKNHDQVLIVGGLTAFGIDGGSPAFILERNLGAENPLRPALILNYHPKYTKFAELFFGVDTSVHKREVGFKPL